MAQNNQDVLLRIKVDGDKAMQAVKQYTEEVESLKRTQNNLKLALKEIAEDREKEWQAYKKGEKSIQDYNKVAEESRQTEARIKEQLSLNSAQLANTSQNLRGYQKELQNVLKQQEALSNDSDGSLVSLRAELSNATKEFDNLSRVEREGAKGTEYLDYINKLTNEIKEAEEATQRYQRNVGNYKSAIEDATSALDGMKNSVVNYMTAGNPMLAMLLNTSSSLGNVKKAFMAAATGAGAMIKQLAVLAVTPVGLVLTAIATAVMVLQKGLATSEERLNRFKVALAPLQGILDGISNAIGVACDALVSLAEALGGAADSTNKYIELEKQRQALTKLARGEIVATAEREREISDLRAKFAEKDKYSNEERLQFLEEAIAKEKEQAEINKRIAQEELAILEKEAALTDNDAEMNDKLEQAKAKVIQADTALSNKMRELNGQRVEAINAIAAEEAAEKKAAEEKAKRWAEEARRNAEEQKTKEKDAIRAAEDAITAIITDNIAKRKAEIQKDYDRQIEDIKTRLATEKNLTVAAREALNTQIGALYIKQQQELNAVDAEVEAQRKAKLAEEEAAAKEARATAQKELIEERATQLQAELELIRSANMSELEEQQAMLEAKIAAKQEEIATMQQLEGESDAEFYLRKLEANNALTDLEEQHKDTNIRIAEEEAKKKREAYNSVMQAMTAMGEHSKALGKVAKIMGLAQIAVDTGKAISSGVASASALPFPANLAAIATTIATVVANMATAITSIKSAKFATGGLVTGAGSGTSDSIPAMLSNGESVMTAQATSAFAPLLSTLNQMGGGVPIQATSIGSQQMGEDMLARAVARGVAELQPVVSVEEINRVSANVRVIESLATI